MIKINEGKNEKELDNAFHNIQSIADKIGLTMIVVDTAKQLYILAKANLQFNNLKYESILAACIYYACKLQNNPRSPKEICSITRAPKKNLMHNYSLLKSILCTKSVDTTACSANGINTIDSYIECFGNQLNLPAKIRKIAKIVANKANEAYILGGTGPTTLVAACLYLVTKKDPEISKSIAEVCRCNESTIKKAYQKLYENRNEISSPDIPEDAWFNP